MRLRLLPVCLLFGLSLAVPAVGADAESSAKALKALKAAIDGSDTPVSLLAKMDFATAGLTKADAEAARELIWKHHAAEVKARNAGEIKDRVLKEKNLEMPFDYKVFGKKPAGGRSLWISMHGGGGAPKEINDRQWENQKKLYTIEEGIYLAPRAPTNTWNLWHEGHIDRFFTRLIADLIVLEEVNPDRVYILGYSAGGDGVYQLAPRMADSWAAAAMMAGHPNGVSLLSVRNLPFALQCGGNDAAYNRNKVAKEYGEQLEKWHKEDPKGYVNFVKIHEGKGHWMNLEDKVALPWMAKFSRNPIPEKIVWKQVGAAHDRFYWLAVPTDEAKGGTLVVATREGQKIDLASVEGINQLTIRLDDRMADLDKPVSVTHAGKELLSVTPKRTIATLVNTLEGRGDPKLMFSAEVAVKVPTAK